MRNSATSCSTSSITVEDELEVVGCVFVGKEREHNLQAGDNVEVCEGELINLQGKILSVDGNKITIMPKHEDLKVNTPSHLVSMTHLLTHSISPNSITD